MRNFRIFHIVQIPALARALKSLILRCQGEYPPIWEIEEKVMLGRNLTEKPTVADVSWRLLLSASYLIKA
jgi:hypothetical protein